MGMLEVFFSFFPALKALHCGVIKCLSFLFFGSSQSDKLRWTMEYNPYPISDVRNGDFERARQQREFDRQAAESRARTAEMVSQAAQIAAHNQRMESIKAQFKPAEAPSRGSSYPSQSYSTASSYPSRSHSTASSYEVEGSDSDGVVWALSDWVTEHLFPLRLLRDLGRWLDGFGPIPKLMLTCVGAGIAWLWPLIASHGADSVMSQPNWLIIGAGAIGGWIAPQLLGKLIKLSVHLIVFFLCLAVLGGVGYGAWLTFAHFANQ
jgi:hypothetical protein